MPRITAPSVAEHRARQHAALMTAAREILLADGPQAVTPAAVGARAGLARSSVYKYFPAGADILAQVVEDIFTVWIRRVRHATEAASTPRTGWRPMYARTWSSRKATIAASATPRPRACLPNASGTGPPRRRYLKTGSSIS